MNTEAITLAISNTCINQKFGFAINFIKFLFFPFHVFPQYIHFPHQNKFFQRIWYQVLNLKHKSGYSSLLNSISTIKLRFLPTTVDFAQLIQFSSTYTVLQLFVTLLPSHCYRVSMELWFNISGNHELIFRWVILHDS